MPAELFSFVTNTKWIPGLWKKLKSIRKKREDELNALNLIIFGDPLVIARYYVEPDCQDRNPADRRVNDLLLANNPIMTIIDKFFGSEIHKHGDNQMFILSGAGMGKTSLLAMLKLMHLTSFWPKMKDCVLKKLGETTIADLSKIEDKKNTILLLDSLDEDPLAYGRVKDRLVEILEASQFFFRVIITCRTQFFPSDIDKNPMDMLGRVSIGGFNSHVKFLSFFTDEKVREYLGKRFPRRFGLLPNTKKMEQAKTVIDKMGSLRCRPMLLAYIEDLMESPTYLNNDSEYRIYDSLITSWLSREQLKDKKISVKELSDACIILAVHMQIKKKRSISEQELNSLIDVIAKVKTIKKIQIKGRSLLNINSEKAYLFSHYSIQEFLVVKLLLEEPVYSPRRPIPMTDFIFRMLSLSGKTPNFPELLDCQNLNLSNIDLKNLRFPGVCFKSVDFSGADLSGCDLTGCDLSNSDLSNADLSGATLEYCQFQTAKIVGADLDNAKLKGACIDIANLGHANFDKADVRGMCLVDSNLDMEFVYIPKGTFLMGEGKNQHKVTLSEDFYMQNTQVTQKQWEKIMSSDPSYFNNCDNCPVENVSWYNVQKFINNLNKQNKTVIYALPTEAQWEYACRAGSETKYCFGDNTAQLGEYAWYDKNSKKKTHPVRQLKPNAWGLYDMHGNVWEWCRDWYGDYPSEHVIDPKGPEKGSYKVLRGGSCTYDDGRCRTANRNFWAPEPLFKNLGFRLIMRLQDQQFQAQKGK